MGTSRSVSELHRKVFKAAANITTANPDALKRGAGVATDMLNAAIASMVGGDMRASNAPNEHRPSRMSAKAGFVEGTARTLVKIGPKGPVALIDQGAPGHVIGLGRGGVPGAGRGPLKKVDVGLGVGYDMSNADILMVTPWGPRYGPFLHPGTTGKHRWTQVRDKRLPKALIPVFTAVHTKAVAKAFL